VATAALQALVMLPAMYWISAQQEGTVLPAVTVELEVTSLF
jgi:hypothetical protein